MSKRDVIQSHIEVLMEQLLAVDELKINNCGEIPVWHRSAVYKVRVAPNPVPSPHVEVYAIAVEDVDADPGLYEALNSINSKLSHSRAFWTERMVVIASQMVGETLGMTELACTCDEIATVADREGPVLAAAYGGHVARPDYVEEDE